MPNFVKIVIEEKEFEAILNKKNFKTGSTGYNASGKLEVNNQKFQISVNVVLIGSKPKK